MPDWRIGLQLNTPTGGRGAYPFGRMLSLAGARRARAEIAGCPHYAPTPLVDLPGAAREAGVRRVLYKDEAVRFGLQSFKALGGAYAVGRILAERVSAQLGRPAAIGELARKDHGALTRSLTVTCASDGNHGRAVAAGARTFGCGCVIFLHEGVSAGREAAIAAFGAQVVRTPGDYDDSVRIARETAAQRGWILVSDTAEAGDAATPAIVMQGYGVIVLELLEQLEAMGEATPTHVFVQGGVGGLAAALLAPFWEALGPERTPTFVVVEPERADCLFQSARAGRPAPASGDLGTVMAGLSCSEVSRVAWPILQAGADGFMTVPDAVVAPLLRRLADDEFGAGPIVAGESAVAGLAGLLATGGEESLRRRLKLGADSLALVIGTEGATDPDIYRRLLAEAATNPLEAQA